MKYTINLTDREYFKIINSLENSQIDLSKEEQYSYDTIILKLGESKANRELEKRAK